MAKEKKGASENPPVEAVIVTKKYRDPQTSALVTLEHNQATGEYVETIDVGGNITKTKHSVLSHAWARLEEVKQ